MQGPVKKTSKQVDALHVDHGVWHVHEAVCPVQTRAVRVNIIFCRVFGDIDELEWSHGVCWLDIDLDFTISTSGCRVT
jgi:hypothetical protein